MSEYEPKTITFGRVAGPIVLAFTIIGMGSTLKFLYWLLH